MNIDSSKPAARLVIVGGVAGGATAAARARRLNENAQITLIERGPYISYANCGLPYYIARQIEKRDSLLLVSPEDFARRYRVDVRLQTEALKIDRDAKRLLVKNTQGESWIEWDRLILAQGGMPVRPNMPGIDSPNVFTLWNVPDMDRLDSFITTESPRTAVVVGGGFIGLEMAEAFTERGISTTVVELMPTVMGMMDPEFGVLVERELAAHGVKVLTGIGVSRIHHENREVELANGKTLEADLVLFSTGVRPEISLARDCGLEIGPSGALAVNDRLQTSDPDIFAAGDMIEVENLISGRRTRIPLAGPANRQGRIAASSALGEPMRYPGALGTSVVKVFEATAGMTGLNERSARQAGFNTGVAVIHANHHAKYYPGARELTLKLVYDRDTSRLLGAQAFGHAGIDKRMDVLATALRGELTLEHLSTVDLSYAPPFSSANDPVNVAAFVALNDISGYSPTITGSDLANDQESDSTPVILDVRTEVEFNDGHVESALNIPVDELRERLGELPRDRRIAIYCRGGFRGHLASRMLRQNGWDNVVNVTGGWLDIERRSAASRV